MNNQQCDGSGVVGNHDDIIYDQFLEKINQRFNDKILDESIPLFTTNATGLFEAYLSAFPDDQRQYHNCHACKHFIEKFGSLVTINSDGTTEPAIWNAVDAPDFYKGAISVMAGTVRRAKVTGVFLSSESTWGKPVTGIWKHFYIKPDRRMIYHKLHQNAGQAMAEKHEDFKNVIRAMADFKQSTIGQALRLLESESLYRSEKVIGPVKWLRDLHELANVAKNRTNAIWRAVAMAPVGFCHPRSSMAGTLLEDIAAGMNFEQVSRRFADKMHPLQYQRPQAAPKIGNIEHAEKLVEKLGIELSLHRRFARIDEVEALWIPSEVESQDHDGVFGHLKNKPIDPMRVPAQTITWVKFAANVLPTAKQIEVLIPYRGDFIALVTAINEDAPPILQWDLEERRNPVSWYRYHNGSFASQWKMTSDEWRKATAVCLYPGRWHGAKTNHSKDAMFIIDGAVDTQSETLAIFPETLKSELYQIRSTIEAYSKSKKLSGMEEASACGIGVLLSHIRIDGIEYKIDRWD